MKHTAISISAIIILIAQAFSLSAAKGPDLNFLKKSAQKVWALEQAQFNPAAQFSDSIFKNAAAVNIAIYSSCKAHRSPVDEINNMRPTPQMMLGETDVETVLRRMVKINDASALKDFLEFSFRPDVYRPLEPGIPAYSAQYAFGARIHKPDGRIVDIDMSETLTVTEGKKGKEATSHKIAIPGLEVGDVLEYFYLNKFYFLGNLSMEHKWDIFSEYPTSSYLIETSLDPELTTEFHTYNGIEPVTRAGFNDGRNEVYFWDLHNIPASDHHKWCSEARQFPFITVSISDNVSRLFKSLKSARPSGVYMNLTAPVILAEIAEKVSLIEIESDEMSRASSILNNYRKNHPGLSDDETADAAWLTVRYVSLLSDHGFSPYDQMAFLKDLLDNCKLSTPAHFAVTSSKHNIDVREVANYTQVSPAVVFGKRTFIGDWNPALAPGEVIADFAGETIYTFEGKRSKIFSDRKFFASEFPAASAVANGSGLKVNISVPDPESSELNVTYKAESRGSNKDTGYEIISTEDFAGFAESYLEIPDKMKAQRHYDVVKINETSKKNLDKLPGVDFDIENFRTTSSRLISLGNTSADNKLTYEIDFTADGLMTPTDDGLIINIGAFAIARMNHNENLPETRKISIITDGPERRRTDIILNIPQRYHIDPSDIEQFKVNIANVCGGFFADASIDPDNGNLKLVINQQNNSSSYHPSRWADFLAIRRAISSFGTSTLVLHRD